MRRFASLAHLVSGKKTPDVDWNSARKFRQSVEPSLLAAAEEARDLIRKEEKLLGLGVYSEPFRVDLGLHRWLQDESEPVYSDWLQWIVRALDDKEWIFRLLGVGSGWPTIGLATPKPTVVNREVPVWKRDSGKLLGFLDLMIWFGKKTRVVVEVKKFDENYEKQSEYRKALEGDGVETDFILLSNEFADSKDVCTFRARNWRSFCVEGRKLIPEVAREKGLAVATLMLAFIGAVEQNILGLTDLRRLFLEGADHSPAPVDLKTMRYLQKIVQEEEP